MTSTLSEMTLTVDPQSDGMRVLDFLTDELIKLSSSSIQLLLKNSRVTKDGHVVQGGHRVHQGEALELDFKKLDILRIEAAALPGFSVLYEDAALIVAAKPAGVGVTPDRGDNRARFVGACLKHFEDTVKSPNKCPRPRIVHRLDKGTTGAVLIAKSREALKDLTEQFQSNSVTKTYHALAQGVPVKDEALIDLPIGVENRGGKIRVGGKETRPASTALKVLERFRGHSLLELVPKTGRQHQIRVHLEAVGHPLTVDPLYGGTEVLKLSDFKRAYVPNRRGEERPLLERLSLHAARIEFRSPATQEAVIVEAPYPKDLRVTLKQLRRWAPARR